MKHLKMLCLAAFAAMVLMAIGASSASATTLEREGVKQTGAVKWPFSLESGTFLKIQKTDGTFANSCAASTVEGTTSTFTGTAVSGPNSTLTFSSCTNEKVVVDAAGSLSIENIAGTTNGTVKWSGAKVTVPSPFGALTCETGTGADAGTFTGKATGQLTWDFHGVWNCGFLGTSVTWQGAFVWTGFSFGVTS
jgi:hypothetical protein